MPSKEEYIKRRRYFLDFIEEVHQTTTGYKLPGNYLNEGILEGIIRRSFEYDNLLDIAAHFLLEIARDHPFNDGNKRTAFVVGNTIALLHEDIKGGKESPLKDKMMRVIERLNRNDKEIVESMIEIAQGKKTFKETRDFIARTTKDI